MTMKAHVDGLVANKGPQVWGWGGVVLKGWKGLKCEVWARGYTKV